MGRCWGNTRSYIDHRDQTILTRDSRENVQIRTDWPFLIKYKKGIAVIYGLTDEPRIIAPALLRRLTTPASSGTMDPKRLNDPAVVFIPMRYLVRSYSHGKSSNQKPSEDTVAMLSCQRISRV